MNTVKASQQNVTTALSTAVEVPFVSPPISQRSRIHTTAANPMSAAAVDERRWKRSFSNSTARWLRLSKCSRNPAIDQSVTHRGPA